MVGGRTVRGRGSRNVLALVVVVLVGALVGVARTSPRVFGHSVLSRSSAAPPPPPFTEYPHTPARTSYAGGQTAPVACINGVTATNAACACARNCYSCLVHTNGTSVCDRCKNAYYLHVDGICYVNCLSFLGSVGVDVCVRCLHFVDHPCACLVLMPRVHI